MGSENWQMKIKSVLFSGLFVFYAVNVVIVLGMLFPGLALRIADGAWEWKAIGLLVLTAAVLAALHFAKKLRLRRERLPRTALALYMVMNGVLIVAMGLQYLSLAANDGLRRTAAVTILFLIAAAFLGTGVFAVMSDRAAKQAELEKDIENARMVESHNDEIRSMYAAMQEYQHDLKHQFFLIEQMIAQGRCDAGGEYLEKLAVPEWTNQYCVGNMAVDALIAAKAMHIRHKGIRFTFTAYPLDELPISETEFCAVLGNVLDNAIEAVSRIQDEGRKKEISLRFSRFRNMLYITCKNSADRHMVVRHGEVFFSSKRNGKPGRGIPSVRRIVDRANGLLSTELLDDRFIVAITLPYLGGELDAGI